MGGRKEEDSRGWVRELALRKAKMFPCHRCHAMTPAQSAGTGGQVRNNMWWCWYEVLGVGNFLVMY